ncbi:MAG: hypothetical protein U5J63_05895 [Fodinibius sp.]|nr:hypothetical protein [Fodinibius sp.]
MRHSKIIASGSYAPERVIKNEWFNERLGEDVDTWLRENLTIRERRWMSEDQSTSDLCVEAGNAALDMAGMQPKEIDLLIIATDTPDFISPSTASAVQHKTGACQRHLYGYQYGLCGLSHGIDAGQQHDGDGSGL